MTIANANSNCAPVLPLPLPFASTGEDQSYFTAVPTLPPALASNLVRSTPTIYSPLPITPPTLPRRPSSAGSRQPAIYQLPFLSPGKANTDIKALSADSGLSAHQYAALRVAQASAAASAAKESAVARLQAKHEAWSKTAQIRIESESASFGSLEGIVSGHSTSLSPLIIGHDNTSHDEQQDRKEKSSSLRDGFTRLTNTLRPVAETSSFHHSSSSTLPLLCILPGFIDYSTPSAGYLAKRPSLASQTSFGSTQRRSVSSVSSGLGHSGGSQSSSFTGRLSTSSITIEAQQPTAVPPCRIFGAASTAHATTLITAKARHRSHTISGNTSSSTPTRPSPSLLAKGATEPPPRPEPLPQLDMSFQSLSNMPEAGPSSAVAVSTSPISAKGSSDAPKKKRIGKDGLPREGKRKKVSKACLACQKSHLTCDEQRPCTRCVKKGFADQCVEGVRKKAKYLLEAGDRQSPDQSESPTGRFPSVPPDIPTAPLHTSYSPTTVPGLANLGDTNMLPSLSDTGGIDMNLPGGLGGLGGVNFNLANPMDQHGMDVWLAPAPAQQTLVDGDVSGGYDGGRGMSPIGGKEADWGSMFVGGSDNAFGFGTTASNEYAMLDAMLNSMSPVFPFDFVNDGIQGDSDPLNSTGRNPLDPVGQQRSSYNQAGSIVSPNWPNSASNAGFTPPGGISGQGLVMTDTSLNTQQQPDKGWGWNGPQRQGPAGVSSVNDGTAANGKIPTNRVSFSSTVNRSAVDQAPQITVKTEPLTTSPVKTTLNPTAAAAIKGTGVQRPKSGAEVYHSVTKPFDYTEGYHRLMEWMSRSFEQQEVLRVVKALAAFRPSLIALQMPMSEEDEVFLERSFQRTLIELEKLISYSATPTAVWRRTGDLVYANPEFCSLLGKQQSELLSGKTYIYHLLARSSVISYWENFSVHAFENTTQNFFQSTTLQVGDKETACSCCFTIRRDVFDLPSVIIGQFLPIPSE